MKKLIILLLFIPLVSNSQYATADDVKKMAEKMNENKGFKDPRSGLELSGVTSIGTTLMILYEAPENWYLEENMKKLAIENYQTSGISETFFKFRINKCIVYFFNKYIIIY